MKRLVAMVTASTGLVMLLSSIAPAQAANPDGAMAAAGGSTFHALSRMLDQADYTLTPLTDDELASFTNLSCWECRPTLALRHDPIVYEAAALKHPLVPNEAGRRLSRPR